jgi:cell surface protein SprA
MIFRNKTYTIILFCGILFSSAYALVTASAHPAAAPEVSFVEPSPADTATKEKPKFPIKKFTQNTYEEIDAKLPMDAPKPDNVKSVVEYDAKSGNYVLRTFVGESEIATPFLMTEQEYRNYTAKRELQNYWKEKNSKAVKSNEEKFSVSDMKFNIGPADKLFGPGGVQIKTQGSAELVFGYKSNKIDNPALTERMRRTGSFNFDEKIQMNVTGSVGDKVNFGLNYNTESSFDFDQKMVKLAYKGKEDDIIKSIEAGNVSMQLNSALITGSTALFGVKTEMQFGKLSVSAIASQQESQTQTVSSKGGAQTTKFDVGIDKYDDNRHFFLAHYFRDKFESSMSKLPYIASGITINRVEAWVTNKRGNYDQARNIIAFMDLAETDSLDNNHWNTFGSTLPKNKANSLYDEINLLPNVRDVQKANAVLSDHFSTIDGINGGEDYEKIESARRLDQSEFTVNKELGFISLRNAFNPDGVLGVSFEYTYGGQTYQVGEFSTDPVTAPSALIVKLLKGTAQNPQLKIWDLMMKNVYDLGAMDIQKDNFKLNIVYRNDSVGTDMQYVSVGGDKIKNKILLQAFNLDNLDSKNEAHPDGIFDFIPGYTILPSSGRIIFPELEPFGFNLAKKLEPNFDPKKKPSDLVNKYVYQQLYDSTLVVAQEFSEKNKFRITGEYKGTSGSEIRLSAMNVPRGSVSVTAGGATLVENVDYTVDYTMGTVTILNQSLITAGTQIDVKLENQSTFSMQRKSLMGSHLEYKFNKDFSLGGTIMHLSEMPLTSKVNTGNEPISNTIWGLNTSWRTESQWLTNMLDKLPFVNATKPSTIALNAEFAQLVPGHSKVVGKEGLAYIDDFEATKTTIDIHYPVNWYLASTPYNPDVQKGMFPEAALSDNIEYGKNRALMSWYYVDPLFNEERSTTPTYIRNNPDYRSNHLTRYVSEQEIFPNRSRDVTRSSRMTIMNLSFYPNERGPYNLDVNGMNTDGTLSNPEKRWGGIMRKLDATDFETSNIEYIEFWMMDPYVNGGMNKAKKGDLYFNLGDVSEDILKDGKKFFEHGLPYDGDSTKTDTTVWGRIPKIQSTVTAFSGDRKNQDVGLDGLPNDKEFIYPAYQNYVAQVKAKITDPIVLQKMKNDPFSPLNDPSGDNYHFYRGTDYDNAQIDVISRYKHYNGPEGNSPDASQTSEKYSTTATSLPDQEDINNDNTLNEYEKYYQYRVRINPDSMIIGKNHITDIVTSVVKLDNNIKSDEVKWYQFKIPIREYEDKIGSIRNFKSIRFIRMFMTNFDQAATLRLATLDLVRGEWRNFNKPLHPSDKQTISEGKLDVQAVNIEENANKSPVHYVLPPGVSRETDPGQPALLQLNEQSMVLRVSDLSPSDARGVYKNTSYDMRQYKRLQMFVHAEKMADNPQKLNDNDLTCFIRLGSDLVNNYYEYEIPLKLTPGGVLYSNESSSDREKVWMPENMFDFSFDKLTNVKLKRNKEKQSGSGTVSNLIPYTDFDPDKLQNKITIVGNPSISDVQNVLIGVRNRGTEPKSGEIWVNELRMSQFDESGGWAAMGNMAVGLSDIGSVNVSGRMETAGYGSIESNVNTRRQDNLYQVNFSTSLELGRFLPEKAKFQIPAYFSYRNETLAPKYNPLDQDVLLSDAVANESTQAGKDSILAVSQTVNTTKSFSISGAKINIKSKKPQFYDPANVSVGYSLNETNQHSADIEKNQIKDEKASLNYNFNFNPEPVEPFKNVKALDKPAFRLIKDFNFYFLPTSLSFNTNMSRQFSQVKLRDLNAASAGYTTRKDTTFSKDFMWNRNFDIKFDLTKGLKLSFQTVMNANIDESRFTPEIGKEYYEKWRDTVMASIRKLGNPYLYQQVFSATWNLPINKLPLLDWVTANASYNSNYNWNKMAQIKDSKEDMGNTATSTGAWQGDGQLNFENLYNKIKYLKDVNKRFSAIRNANQPTFQSKTYSQKVNLEKDKVVTINHRLGSEKIKFTATDKTGKIIPLKFRTKNATSIEIMPASNVDSVMLSMVSLDPNNQPPARMAADFIARTLMMVRRASITYRQSNSMVLTGFKSTPGFLGQQDTPAGSAPGYAFTFGIFDDNYLQTAKANNWLNTSQTIVNPATLAFTSDLDVKASIEPIAGFKIDLNAKRYEARNTSVQYMYETADGIMPTTYTGSYNITLMALSTAFKKTGTVADNYNSELFNNLLSNRQVIADRLNSKLTGNYPNTGFLKDNHLGGTRYDQKNGTYDKNSADVLIPAFLAAYTGRDVNTVSTNPFLSLLSVLPNWRISYDGLSNIGWIKDHFKSISLTHAYSCRYSIGSYTSYSTWVAMGNADKVGFVSDVRDETKATPSSPYDISDITLSEQFSPLIGVNVAMKNSVTGKVEFRKQRNLVLNLSSTQLVESGSDEYVIGFGYLLKDFDVIMKFKSDKQSKIKNDLKLSADLSYKDIKTLLRKVQENITQASSGNKLFTFKFMADYVFSSKVNIQLFYDRQSSTPLISSSFPVSSSNFGLSFKFMLTR